MFGEGSPLHTTFTLAYTVCVLHVSFLFFLFLTFFFGNGKGSSNDDGQISLCIQSVSSYLQSALHCFVFFVSKSLLVLFVSSVESLMRLCTVRYISGLAVVSHGTRHCTKKKKKKSEHFFS